MRTDTKPDWYLNSSRAKPLLAQPDRFYIDFLYNTLHNHLYHMDFDTVLVDKNLKIIALIESITGLDREITDFKKVIYIQMAKALNVPFYVTNWDKSRGVQVTDVFSRTTKFQTWQEHEKWLRDFKYSTSPDATPHSECCDCIQCIP